jgi:hypothetical protein
MTSYKNTTSTISSNVHAQINTKNRQYNIQPVKPVESHIIHHYQDALAPRDKKDRLVNQQLIARLEFEQQHAKRKLNEHTQDLTQQILALVKQYNSLVEILVKIEAIEGCQIDQSLQHFLVFHRHEFSYFGISIRQFLYLEYDPIILKSSIKREGVSKTSVKLIGSKGLFGQLLFLFDRLVMSLTSRTLDESFGHHIDTRA